MRTKKIMISFLILLSILNMFVLINSVKATNYEWILNSGFEDKIGTEQFINGNFESGSLDGGWNGTATIVTTTYVSPTHSAQVANAVFIWYTFSKSIPIGNINTFTYWGMHNASGTAAPNPAFTIYYSDGTSINNNSTISYLSNTWQQYNVLSYVTLAEGKEVSSIKIMGAGTTPYTKFDDFSLKTYELGQENINTNTSPWFAGKTGLDANTNQTIVTNKSHSGNCSFYNYVSSYQTLSILDRLTIQQNINYLPTNNITSMSLWINCGSNAKTTIKFIYSYSDGSLSEKSISFYSYNIWTKLDFISANILNKNLIKISFIITEGSGAIWIDDISLLANISLGTTDVSWILTPIPYSYNSTSFEAYMYVNYQFTASIYSPSGTLSENGTFTVTTQKGFTQGNMTFGIITFTLSQRTKVDEYDEVIIIVVNVLGTSPRTFVIAINANWIVTSPLQTTPATTGIYDNVQPSIGISFMGGMILVIVFAVIFGSIAGRDGLMAGLSLGTFLASISGLFPIYGLILTVIFGILMVVSHTGIPNSGSTGGTK